MPKINLVNFKEIIMKATLNNSIDTLQLIFEEDRIKSKMKAGDQSCITDLNVENNIININEYITFNFNEPSMEILPYIDLIDSDEADIEISDQKIRIRDGREKYDLHFCHESRINVFGGDDMTIQSPQTVHTIIDENFLTAYEKAKRIAARFKKIYFNVQDRMLSMEASDRTNAFTNRFKYDILKTEEMEDFTICFNFRNFVNFMKIVCLDPSKFNITFIHVESHGLGLMSAISENEKYYLMSRDL